MKNAAISPCDLQGGKDGGNRALQIAGSDCHGQKGLADCEARLSTIFEPCELKEHIAVYLPGDWKQRKEWK